MEKERFDVPETEDQDWFQDFFTEPAPDSPTDPDEPAVYTDGLTDPVDAQLEQILAEDWLQQEASDIPAEDILDPLPGDAPPFDEDMTLADMSVEDIFTREELEQTRMVEVFGQDEEAPLAEDATQVIPAAADDMTQVIPSVQDDSATQVIPQKKAGTDAQNIQPSRRRKGIPSKRRPGIKKGYGLFGIPHILSTAIWAAIILAIGLSLGRVLWVCCADIMAFGRPKSEASITITEEDDIASISQKLADAGLIAYPGLFQSFAELTGKDERISKGTFTLGSHLDYNAMINSMTSHGGARVEVEVLFPEGINCAQTFRILEKKGVCTIAELEEAAANADLGEYWFLEGVERGHKYCLEGYLAPDTYRFYTNDDPSRVLRKFLNEFDSRFTDIMKEDLAKMQERYANMLRKNGYDDAYIQEHPLTLHQVLTVASIVDRETASDVESYDIASVFYNRLTNPDYPTLGSDATVYYAIGDYFREKDTLSEADLAFDSPYNTRVSQGLPPTPICNPSVFSLYAALDPNDTNYYFFIYNREEYYHLFSRNYEEHMKKAKDLGY